MKPNPKSLLELARNQAAKENRWQDAAFFEEMLLDPEKWDRYQDEMSSGQGRDRLQGVGVWLMVGLAILFFLAMYLGAFR